MAQAPPDSPPATDRPDLPSADRSLESFVPDTGDGGGQTLCDLTRPVRLSREYVRRIQALEASADDQSGVDKTWVEELDREYRTHYANARRLRE